MDAEQPPTLAPTLFDVHRARTNRVVSLAFAVGVLWFGYGVGATEPRPSSWATEALVQTVLLAVGGFLVSLTVLVTAWTVRQDQPRPLQPLVLLVTGLLASLVPTGVLVVGHWWRVGAVSLEVPFLDWVLPGLVVIGAQLYVGSLEPADRRHRLLLAEAVLVALVALWVLTLRPGTDPMPLASVLAASLGATAAFLVVGGGLARLGTALACRPRDPAAEARDREPPTDPGTASVSPRPR